MTTVTLGRAPDAPRVRPVVRHGANLVGAVGAGWFAWESLSHFLVTRTPIGAAFVFEQSWIVVAYLVRRPAASVSARTLDWLVAFTGTFAGVLFSPDGLHPHWGVELGWAVQFGGLALSVASLWALGRSFGFAAADRGLVRRGPYGVVRHPIYVSYIALQLGYVLQSASVRNVLVMVLASGSNVARLRAEERFLDRDGGYARYREVVAWRLVPGLW